MKCKNCESLGTPSYIDPCATCLSKQTSQITPAKAIEIIKNLNFRATGETKQNDLAIDVINKVFMPKETKQEYTCPSCSTYNETLKKRMNTVKHDIMYCWHCGQAIKF